MSTQDTASQMPPSEIDIRQLVGDTYYIYSSNLSLTQADIPYALPAAGGTYPLADYKIHIQADTVTLNGTVVNRGKDFSLVARRVILAGLSTIDVTGPDPIKDFAPDDLPQQLDSTPGAVGSPGAPADDGAPAGQIYFFAERVETPLPDPALRDGLDLPLILLAQGGRGGNGQPGHPGMTGGMGAQGPNWWDLFEDDDAPYFTVPAESDLYDPAYMNANIWNDPAYDPCRGAPGQTGGQGGPPGQAGAGGDGGTNWMGTVYTDRATAPNRPVGAKSLLHACNFVDPGAPGATSPAPGGVGGPGGEGGHVWAYIDYPGDALTPSIEGQALPGPQGAHGPDGAGSQGGTGNTGLGYEWAGSVWDPDTQQNVWSYAQLAPRVDSALLLLTQRVARLAYLNAPTTGDYATPATLFQWLADITAPASTSDLGFTPDVVSLWQAINASANVELTRFSQGLDYYGHPATWAPTLTVQYLSSAMDTLLPLAEGIESDFDAFSAQAATAQDRANSYASTRAHVTALIAQLGEMQKSLQTSIDSAFSALEDQNAAIEAQKQRVTDAKFDFDQAWADYVSSKSGCSLSDVLDVVKAIVAMGQAAYDGVGAITGAFGDLANLGTDLTKFTDVVQQVQKVTGDIDSIRTGWATVKGAITPANPDAGKLVMEENDFDKTIEPYMSEIPDAATELKDAVDHYIDLVKAKGKLVLDYNALFIKKTDLAAQAAQRQAELDHVDVQYKLDTSGTVLLPIYLSFMSQAYESVKAYAVWLLYQETRAYEYWSLTERPLDVSDLRVSMLSSTHAGLKEDLTTAMGNTESLESRFTGKTITVDAATYPSAFAALATTKKLNVQLSIDDPAFENFWNVRVDTVAVALPGVARTSGTLTVSLLHNGDSPFYSYDAGTRTTTLQQFTHGTRMVGFQYDYGSQMITSPGTVGDEAEGYANLSPFTLWTINFDFKGNEWLDLGTVESVALTFTGYWEIEDAAARARSG